MNRNRMYNFQTGDGERGGWRSKEKSWWIEKNNNLVQTSSHLSVTIRNTNDPGETLPHRPREKIH